MLTITSNLAAPAVTLLWISMLANQVSAMPALANAITPRQETGGGYSIPAAITTTYDVTSSDEVNGTAFNDPASAGPGVTITHTESYTVGYSITVGAGLSLDIDEILSLSGTVSITKETSTGSSDGVSAPCPSAAPGDDQWTCSLAIVPHMMAQSGSQTQTGYDIETLVNAYTVLFPLTAGDNNLAFTAYLCSCGNEIGWGSPNAPPLCPNDC